MREDGRKTRIKEQGTRIRDYEQGEGRGKKVNHEPCTLYRSASNLWRNVFNMLSFCVMRQA